MNAILCEYCWDFVVVVTKAKAHWAKMLYKEQFVTADGESEDDISKGDIISSLKIIPNYKQ